MTGRGRVAVRAGWLWLAVVYRWRGRVEFLQFGRIG